MHTILRVGGPTAAAMIAFAANSLLCRLALQDSAIDPATFTAVRIVSGAAVLAVVARIRRSSPRTSGSWTSATALFTYAAAFSYAYVTLPAGTGALLLFGAVQLTMVGTGLARGERPGLRQWAGIVVAAAGLTALVWPGVAAPSGRGATLMTAAGIAWGVYSLRGRRGGDPVAATAGNFLRCVPLVVLLVLVRWSALAGDVRGVGLAVTSGALTSGLGYVIWYSAVPRLTATTAAVVQLSVPVITAAAATLLLSEPLTFRLITSAVAVLGGILTVIVTRPTRRTSQSASAAANSPN